MGFELEQSQKLTQKLSQKMVQAINILQMNTEALDHYMMEAYMNNPVLEIKKSNNHLADWSKYSQCNQRKSYVKDENNWDDEKDDSKIAFVNGHTDIEDLCIQWHAKKLEKDNERIGEWLIYNINNKGFMDMDMLEVSERYHIPMDRLEDILEKVQELEPAGIGSRNLSERLLIQLRRKSLSTPTLEILIAEYLEELGDKRWQQICKKLGISMEQLKLYMSIIQKLNPIINVVKSKMQELIEGENKKRPLSDEKIKDCLKGWDIEVSRRTVAKYRTGLGILNASKRKEL